MAEASSCHGGASSVTLAREWWMGRVEIDTSAPFESVKEAVTLFEGTDLWKSAQNRQPIRSPAAELSCADVLAIREQTENMEKELVLKERETLDVLKELESTKMIVNELKMKIKEKVSQNIQPPPGDEPAIESSDIKEEDQRNIVKIKEEEASKVIQSSPKDEQAKQTKNIKEVGEKILLSQEDEHEKQSKNISEENQRNIVKIKEEESSEKIQPTPEDEVAENQRGNLLKIDGGQEVSEKIQANESGKSTPGPRLILEELKQAKFNLTRASGGLIDVKSSVESLSRQIKMERAALDKTRERIRKNSSKISELEKELHQTRLMIQFSRINGCGGATYPPDISLELHKLNSEVDQYKKMAEAGESEVSRLRAEIDRLKAATKTAELRFLAAEKAADAARAAESSAVEKVKAAESKNSGATITLAKEELEDLSKKAREAEELCTERMTAAMAAVGEANASKEEMLWRVEEATMELKASRKALIEALAAAESAREGKIAAEAALRRWRRRRQPDDAPRFKNPSPGLHPHHHRPTLSIGQILSQKLNGPSDLTAQTSFRSQPEISFGQMLASATGKPKTKKHFVLARLSVLGNPARSSQTAPNSKKKKKKKTIMAQEPQPSTKLTRG
ncbi:WEB family protein At2g38370-like [Wolffia australiana]